MLWRFTKELFVKFIEDNSLNFCASISFFTIFSLPGVLIVTFAMTALWFDEQVIYNELFGSIQKIVGNESAFHVDQVLENLRNIDLSWWSATIVLLTLLYGATSVFVSIQDGINHIWKIKPQPKRVALKFLLNRILSFTMVISIGVIMILSLSLDTFMIVFRDILVELVDAQPSVILDYTSASFSLVVGFMVFLFIYLLLPDGRPKFQWLLLGSTVSTLLYYGGKYLFTLYLSNTSLSQAYGATGSLIFLLLWVYYASIILMLGAEFIEVCSRWAGDPIKPSRNAVKIITQVVLPNRQ